MTEGLSPSDDLKLHLETVSAKHPRDVAIAMITGMLKAEYARLEETLKGIRERYLTLNVDNPASEHEIADLRLEAVRAYQPAYEIEAYLAAMGADVGLLTPRFEGEFETSAVHTKGWDLSFVSLKESAMRSLGGHCNVIGEVVILERKLYHHTYLAAVMQPAGADKGLPQPDPSGEVALEFHFSTVVFDEDVNVMVEK
ncbi:hypothetical protein [Methanocella arvoryzae]|uniref:Uncharacterized protein n=1 Tax=Methanocella arvoryzae (strain DSM 22066 / NBRC 105507 / MRE50) TaxID=351160 RepID=Q0W4B0_METAR|nr:hypothetical protein [Methanocella arvoryzae]CAJ36783.1 hypothetical protein RCIX1522 [Methanocella arvoryzae MRE50]